MTTVWGVVVSLVFIFCYLGQSVSSGMEGRTAALLQWSCWVVASVVMLICYLFTQAPTG